MAEELKVRIHDWKKMEEKLLSLGAKFKGEVVVEDTYFNQPLGEVLKIANTGKGYFLSQLKSRNGRFEIVKNEKIKNPDELREEFTQKYGVKSVLIVKRRLYDFKEYVILLNLVKGVGDFIIVTGDDVPREIVTETLGIEDPEYITVPFDDLPRK